jgi:predicted porin
MKKLISVALIAGAVGGADLPSSKAADGEPSKPSCFSSVWDYLKSSVKDCPLRYGPITVYATLDGGYGYELWGTPVGRNADKPNYAIQRNSDNTHWLWSANGLSTSTIGVRFAQEVVEDWEVIGVAEAGFNPYTLRLINGPQSLADNNPFTLANQRTSFDSARAGTWDNGQAFVGISNPTYGTLDFGRVILLSQSAIGAYDPVASFAFSQIGFTAFYATFGASATSRINTGFTYRLTYPGFRVAAQAQVGGYAQDNAATQQYQAQIGADFGGFSFDAIAGYAFNALNFQTFGGAPTPVGFDPDSIVRATALNTGGVELLGRYKWEKFKFYAGYIHAVSVNPSHPDFANGVSTIAPGIIAPPGSVTTNAFDHPRVDDTVWTGVRYALMSNLELASGVYWEIQNNYLAAPDVCTGSGSTTSSSKCAGGRYSYSFLIDYLPVPRVNLYAGILVSNVYGGVASGFLHTTNVAPTVARRMKAPSIPTATPSSNISTRKSLRRSSTTTRHLRRHQEEGVDWQLQEWRNRLSVRKAPHGA